MKLSKATLPFIFGLAIASIGCSNVNLGYNSTETIDFDNLDNKYQNRYFSIDYPSGYKAVGNINGTVEMEKLKDMDPEEILSLPMNELEIAPEAENYEWELPEIYIVLSNYKLDLPLRVFMNMSMYSKLQSEDEEVSLIRFSEIDSISFAGYPALEIDFYYKNLSGDTLVQNQIIVQKPDFSLYYLNNNYNSSQPGYERGKKILDSFKFKD